jgi:hypothetical protein
MMSARVLFDDFARRLVSRAETLAAARAETRRLAARGDESRWRRADLVWPLFAKG